MNDRKGPAGETVRLSVPSDLSYCEPVRAFLDVLTRRLEREKATEQLNAHVISAFNEAFNNAVIHGRGEGPDQVVEIEVTLAGSSMTLVVSDGGAGFDLTQVPAPALAELPERGLGLWIMRSYMDQVSYHIGAGRNELTLVKRFAHPIPAEAKAEPSEES